MKRLLALGAALLIGLALAWLQTRPPLDPGPGAPVGVFSASRALEDVKVIAAEPHPVGSAANAKVRDYLLARMSALGLSPQVRPTVGVFYPKSADSVSIFAGRVENLIATLPGRDRTAPALLLMAHYDSVPNSPGAADDAAGTAAILEIVRALKARGQPHRDVMLLITDGEEAGLLGAAGFFRDDPLVRRVGFVINLEARGGAGLSNMFQTGAGNGAVVGALREHFVSPASNALSVFVYERLPNDTDFTAVKAAGLPGLNYAFMGGHFDYHSPTSTWRNLSIGSLQDMGEKGLGAAAEVAYARELPGKAPDAVYGGLLGPVVVAYPPAAGWLVLAAAIALIAVAAWRARGEDGLKPDAILKGGSASLFVLLFSATALQLLGRIAGEGGNFAAARALLARLQFFEAAVALAAAAVLLFAAAALARGGTRVATALMALALGAACSLFGGFDPLGLGLGAGAAMLAALILGRPPAGPGVWLGLLAVAALATLAVQVAAPLVAFLGAWTLLLAAAVAAATGLGARPSRLGAAFAFVAAALAAGWLIGLAHALLVAVGIAASLALTVWLAAPLLWPLAPAGRAPLAAAGALALAALAIAGFIAFAPPWTARHPRHEVVFHAQDAVTGKAYRVSAARPPAEWGKAVLTADGGRIVPSRVAEPYYLVELPTAPAKAVAVQAPTIALTRAGDVATLVVTPPPGAGRLALALKSKSPLPGARLNGVALKPLAAPGRTTRIGWASTPGPLVLTFQTPGPGALELSYAAITYAWPKGAKPLPPIPAHEMQWDISGSTIVTGSQRLGW